MKKKALSIALALVMTLSCLPVSVFAEEDDHDHSQTTSAEETNYENASSENEIDTDVSYVQALINNLPDEKDVSADDYDTVSDTYDAYENLSEEQKESIVGAEVFEGLFNYFNSQIQTLELKSSDSETDSHSHYLCGGSTCNGTGHTCSEKTSFTAWTSSTSLPESGCYYLDTNVTLSSYHTVKGDLTLCLNGHTISGKGNSSYGLILIKNKQPVSSLTLTDCTGNGKVNATTNDAIHVGELSNQNDVSSFNLYNGTITAENKGVNLTLRNTTFNMYGGKITGCKYGVNGSSSKDKLTTCNFNMYGGEITGNQIGVNDNYRTNIKIYGNSQITNNTKMNICACGTVEVDDAFTGKIGISVCDYGADLDNDIHFDKILKYNGTSGTVTSESEYVVFTKGEDGYYTYECLHPEERLYRGYFKCKICDIDIYAAFGGRGFASTELSSLNEAIKASSGGTINLSNNITNDNLSDGIVIGTGGNFTVDLNGMTVNKLTIDSADANVTVKDSGHANDDSIKGKLTSIEVKNGTLKIDDAKVDNITAHSGAKIELDGETSVSISCIGCTLSSLLKKGYAFKADGSLVSSDKTSISGSITVEKCVHNLHGDNCQYCGCPILASVEHKTGNSSTSVYYIDIYEAFEALKDEKSTILIDQNVTDTEEITVENKNFTFNPHTYSFSPPLSFKDCVVDFYNVRINSSFSDITVENGEFNIIDGEDNHFTLTGKLTLKGTVSLSSVSSSVFAEGCEFGKGITIDDSATITVDGKTVTSLNGLIPDGCAFEDSDGNIVNSDVKTLSDKIKVVKHTCTEFDENYKCEDCGKPCTHGSYSLGYCAKCRKQMCVQIIQNGNKDYVDTVKEAVEKLGDGGSAESNEIGVIKPTDETETITVSGKSFTLRFLNSDYDYNFNIKLENCGNVVIKSNSSTKYSGNITISGGEKTTLYKLELKGSLTLENFTGNNSLVANNVKFNTAVTVNGGNIEFNNSEFYKAVTINDGTVNFKNSKLYYTDGETKICGGTVTFEGEKNNDAKINNIKVEKATGENSPASCKVTLKNVWSAADKSTVTIGAGGEVELKSSQNENSQNKSSENTSYVVDGGKLTVASDAYISGNMYNSIEIKSGEALLKGGTINIGIEISGGNLSIEGGKFYYVKSTTGKNIVDYLKDGYALEIYGEGTLISANTNIVSGDRSYLNVVAHTVHSNVNEETGYCECGRKMTAYVEVASTETASTGKIYYSSLEAANNASIENKKIVLVSDVATDSLELKSATLDLNGHSIAPLESADKLTVPTSSTVTIKDSKSGSTAKISIPVVADGGSLAVSSGSLGSLTVNGSSSVSLSGGAYDKITISEGSNKVMTDLLDKDADLAFKDNTATDKYITFTSANEKEIASVCVEAAPIGKASKITTSNSNINFGETITLSAEAVTTKTGVTYKWSYTKDGGETVSLEDKTGSELTYTPSSAGDYVFKCELGYNGYVLPVTANVKVNKKEITDDMVTITNDSLTFIPKDNKADGEEQTVVYTVKNVDTALVKDTDYTVTGDKGTNAGTYTLTITGIGNYKGTVTKTWTIEPLSINGISATVVDKFYDGKTDAIVTKVTLKRNSGADIDFSDKISTNVSAAFDDAKAGESKNVTVTVNLGGNFKYNETTGTVTVNATGKINKYQFEDSVNITSSVNIKNNYAHTYEVDLASLLPTLGEGCSYGTVSYSIGSTTNSDETITSYLDSSSMSIKDGKLLIPIKAVDSTKETTLGTVGVTVEATNYNNFTLNIKLKTINKIALTGQPTFSKLTATYGDLISSITISGSLTDSVSGLPVSGTFSWKETEAETFSSVGEIPIEWEFVPVDDASYNKHSGTVTINVSKAVPTGEPAYNKIKSSGKTLADANLTVGTITPAGEISWDDGDDTVAENRKEYGWTFTPTDSEHYEKITGKITPYKKSSSSNEDENNIAIGGGGVTKPSTPENGKIDIEVKVSDGKATITIDEKDIENAIKGGADEIIIDASSIGNVTEIKLPSSIVDQTKGKDVSVTVTLPTGSITLDKDAIENMSGGKEISIGFKNSDASALSPAQNSALGDKITVEVVVDMQIVEGTAVKSTFGKGKLTVSIPYTPKSGENVNKLSVWYIKDDGSIEVKGGKYNFETKAFVFETEHLSRYILVNTEEVSLFADVDLNAYYAEAVNWAAEKGIAGGIGNNMFAPEEGCTRAQIVSFLWRAAGSPEPKNAANIFTDVNSNEYYYKAVLWAVENGITSGTGEDKFSPNEACTRAQAVCFIYRYAVSNGNGFTGAWMYNLPFTDVEQWCFEAVAWCYKEGITGGTSEDKFSPNEPCTRAQIVSFLYRMLNK